MLRGARLVSRSLVVLTVALAADGFLRGARLTLDPLWYHIGLPTIALAKDGILRGAGVISRTFAAMPYSTPRHALGYLTKIGRAHV